MHSPVRPSIPVLIERLLEPALYPHPTEAIRLVETPCVDGKGEPIEYAVKLVQFDEADRLDSRYVTGRLTAADCRALGEAIAAVEEWLPAARRGNPWGTADSVCVAAAVNRAAIRTHFPEAALIASSAGCGGDSTPRHPCWSPGRRRAVVANAMATCTSPTSCCTTAG